MERFSYTQFHSDTYLKPNWLSVMFDIMMRVIYSLIIILIFVVICYYIPINTSLVISLVCFVVVLLFANVFLELHTFLKPISIRSDGWLLLQRQKIKISDIKELCIYKKQLFLGSQNFVDIKTVEGKSYSVSVSEPQLFCNELAEHNKSIQVSSEYCI